MRNTHLFFLYLPPHLAPESYRVDTVLSIHDKAVANRVHTVLRLKSGETLQFFTGTHVVSTTLIKSPKPKTLVQATITAVTKMHPRSRTFVAAIGLLKKEAFEAAVYSAAQMGATHIIPVITEKSRRGCTNPREQERLHGIIIAACEQSKNPYIPKLCEPAVLADAIKEKSCTSRPRHAGLTSAIAPKGATAVDPVSTLLCFDATGAPMTEWVPRLSQSDATTTIVLIGPEGGLTHNELKSLRAHDALVACLTPTILRSRDAACMGFGLVASVVANRLDKQ